MTSIDATQHLGGSGYGLSVEEKAGLQVTMLQRQQEEGLASLYFWGKIFGEEKDYIVCYGLVPSYDFPQKKFFFCTSDDFTLRQMPDIDDKGYRAKAAAVTGRFKGDPSFLLDGEDEAEPEEGATDERFREMHRLTQTVEAIDRDTSIVPRGAFLVDPSHAVVQNRAFEGLSHTAAGELRSYFHSRPAEGAQTRNALEKDGLVRSTDFLDSISEDGPAGSWSVGYSACNTKVHLRNFVWPGYFFFHAIGTGTYGGAYFGYGQKNDDIAFML